MARDPEDEQRRRFVKGGLLTAAAALGLLPGCGSDKGTDGGDSDDPGTPTTPGTGGGMAPSPGGGGNAPGQAPGPVGDPMAMPGTMDGPMGGPMGTGGTGEPDPGKPMEDPPAMGGLPTRILGKTGAEVTILGLGTSRLGQRGGTATGADYDKAVEVFSAAVDMGITYIDTAAIYGSAEEAVGEAITGRRDDVFLATKIHADTRSEAEMQFERSLERLGTDHVDVLHLHNTGNRDVDTVLSAGGTWPYIQEQKASGRARFCGITGHNNGPNLLRMIQTDEADVLMTVMNFVDHWTYGFDQQLREEAVSRDMGVMCMKIFGGTESGPTGGFHNSYAPEPHPSQMEITFDDTVLSDCMRFAKSLEGATGFVVGANHTWELERNIAWATETEPFSPEELDAVLKMGEMVSGGWSGRYG